VNKLIIIIALAVSFSILMSCSKESYLDLSGTIEASQYDVVSEVSGRVVDIKKNEGENLKKGDEILVIDSSNEELNKDRNQLLIDVKKSQLDELEDSISDSKKEQMELDIKQQEKVLDQSLLLLDKYKIKSQNDGVLNYSIFEIGELVNVGSVVCTVIDLEDLWINMYIPQKHLDLINLNDEINLEDSNGEKIKGKIVYISDKAEFTPKNIETDESKENTVFKFKVEILDDVKDLKPGMTISAKFEPIK
jgi:HlyD family secretion protein